MAADERTAADAAEPQGSPPLVVSTSPHTRDADSIPRIMWTVSFTLLPALACAVAVFGPRALWVTLLATVTAVATEAACQKLRKQPITVSDGSAVLTGLLVAFVLPVHAPWYVPVTASFVAIAVVKQAFGGLGCNIWNPALMGRAFVLSAWAALVTAGAGWPVPYHHRAATVDAVTAATPLTKAKKQLKMFNKGKTARLPVPKTREEAIAVLASIQAKGSTPTRDLFVGRVGGCIGEVSALALLIGGMALILLRYVKWQVPVLFIGTAALLSWALPLPVQAEGTRYYIWFAGQPLFHVLAGGLFLGAFFMATDMVTSPVTTRGQVIFAIGCGVLTTVIRRYGGYPEGVCYAILLMNTATPLIDRHTKPKVFGRRDKP